MPRVKYLKKELGILHNIEIYPNFSYTGSIQGMKERYYGKDCLLVRCGAYIYNVTSNPEIYEKAK